MKKKQNKEITKVSFNTDAGDDTMQVTDTNGFTNNSKTTNR